MTQLALASFVFVALHILPAIRARDWLIRRIGDPAYMGLFSLASGLGLAWMIYAYANAPSSEPLWVSGPALKLATAIAMLFAFVLLVTANTSPNPTAVQGKGALKTRRQWTNIFAVTRHPLMWSIAIWAGLHLLNRPDATSALFFGPLAFLAIAGPVSQEARKRREFGKAWDDFAAQTSFVPFVALASGRAKLDVREIGAWPLATAAVLWLATLYFHGTLFGASPISV